MSPLWGFVLGVFVYKATDTVFSISLPADTLLCPNQQLLLHPQRQGFLLEDTLTTYLWSTRSTDSSIVVSAPGTYWVRTTINQRFVAEDTIVENYYPANYRLNMPDTVLFCEGEEALIQATTDPMQLTAYMWNTGSKLSGIKVRTPGLYYLNAQTPCYPLADSTWVLQDFCETHLWMPNAFTPASIEGYGWASWQESNQHYVDIFLTLHLFFNLRLMPYTNTKFELLIEYCGKHADILPTLGCPSNSAHFRF